MSNVRNVCAHYGRLYNKRLTFKPRLFKEEKAQINNNRIFAAIHVMQRLISKTEGNRFITNLAVLISEYEEHIDFLNIGFPNNWTELLTNLQTKKVQ